MEMLFEHLIPMLYEPGALVFQAVAYLLLVFLLKGVMRSREPMECKGIMRIYNVVQIVVCSYMTYGRSLAKRKRERERERERAF
jgi:hypothetical protein